MRAGLAVAMLMLTGLQALAEETARQPLEITVGRLREGHGPERASVAGGKGRQPQPATAAASPAAVDPMPTGSLLSSSVLRPGIAGIDGAGAVNMALAASARIRAAMADEDAASARVTRAHLAFLPTITAGVRFSDGPETYNSITNPTMVGTLSLNMPIFDGGRRINALNGARSALAASANDVEASRLQIAAETLSTAVELDYATSQAGILGETLRALQGTLAAVRSRQGAGLAGDGEVAEVEAEIAEIRRALASVDGAAAKARASLGGKIGGRPEGDLDLPALEAVVERGPQWLAEQARTHSPRVRAAWNRFDAATFNHKATLGKYLPRVEMTAEYGMTRNYGTSSDPNGLTVGLSLKVPLLEATTVAEVREARAQAEAARYRAMDEAERFRTQAEVDWEEYSAAGEKIGFAERKTGALRKALAAKREQYRAGLIPIDDVLYLSRKVAEARVQEAEAKSQRYAAMVSMAAGAGILVDELDRRAPNAALGPVQVSEPAGLPGVRNTTTRGKRSFD